MMLFGLSIDRFRSLETLKLKTNTIMMDFIVIANAEEDLARFNGLYGKPVEPMTEEDLAELEEFARCL